jgi:hypothetical protein
VPLAVYALSMCRPGISADGLLPRGSVGLQAATTKLHSLGDLDHRPLFSQILQAGSPSIWCRQGCFWSGLSSWLADNSLLEVVMVCPSWLPGHPGPLLNVVEHSITPLLWSFLTSSCIHHLLDLTMHSMEVR